MDEQTIDLTDDRADDRAEDVQPLGFIPSHLATPMLRGRATTQLEYVATELGGIRIAADLIGGGETLTGDRDAARVIGDTATRLQRLVRALASGALIVGLAVAGLAASPAPAQAAVAAGVTTAAPATEAPQPDPAPVKHATKFGRGTWVDLGGGDELVSAPLFELFPGFGWLASPDLPVQVQEYSVKRGRWVIRKVMVTNGRGVAVAVVHLGGGVRTVRVVATETPWTLRATGSTRQVVVTTEPCDIV